MVALTPLKQHLVPGYVDEQYKDDALNARIMADSAMKELEQQQAYLAIIGGILKGEISPDSVDLSQPEEVNESVLNFNISEEDSSLRSRIEDEEESGSKSYLFKPVN